MGSAPLPNYRNLIKCRPEEKSEEIDCKFSCCPEAVVSLFSIQSTIGNGEKTEKAGRPVT